MNSEIYTRIIAIAGTLVISVALHATSSFAAAPLSMKHFDDASGWPTYSAGDIVIHDDQFKSIHVAYDGIFHTPNGPMMLATTIDVDDVMYKGIPARRMQWSFTSEEEGAGGVPNIDLLIMDSKTGGLRFRALPAGQGDEYEGLYNFITASADTVKRVNFSQDGTVTHENISISGPVFDFGGLPFVLPFMDLSEHSKMRLNAYQQSGADGVQLLDVKVIGETKITDTKGRFHNVREVQTSGATRETVISFYIADEAPYFYGWDYRNVESGASLFKMIYRGHVHTDIER